MCFSLTGFGLQPIHLGVITTADLTTISEKQARLVMIFWRPLSAGSQVKPYATTDTWDLVNELRIFCQAGKLI
jgi:hypothetical protein